MGTPERRYLSEFAVNLFSAGWLAIPAHQINADGEMSVSGAEISKQCHIYLICRRPSLSFSPATFRYERGTISGDLQYKVSGEIKTMPFSRQFSLLDGAVSLRLSAYPHREIETIDSSGAVVRYLPASLVGVAYGLDDLCNLEVLYVGQAFGDGNRTALDRIRSHKTLQRILADCLYSRPDDEVLVLAFAYAPYRVITMLDGRSQTAIRDERDGARFHSILEQPLSEEQQISLIEAGLIRYFQPPYNEIYRESFPSPSQKILQTCYALDFSALTVEIDTGELRLSLYSKRVRPDYHHIAQFDLFDPSERLSFFALRDDDGNIVSMPDVIPPAGSEKR